MNERIKELALQAKEYARGFNHQHEVFEKKFAELIVQDCIDIVSYYTVKMSRPGEEYLHPISEIKKHFGTK
jgi:hypothetical protein